MHWRSTDGCVRRTYRTANRSNRSESCIVTSIESYLVSQIRWFFNVLTEPLLGSFPRSTLSGPLKRLETSAATSRLISNCDLRRMFDQTASSSSVPPGFIKRRAIFLYCPIQGILKRQFEEIKYFYRRIVQDLWLIESLIKIWNVKWVFFSNI